MRLDWLTAHLPTDAELITVVLDSTRESESGEQAVRTRWQDLRRSLQAEGAGDDALAQLDEQLSVPSHVGGRHGRVLVAGPRAVYVDRLLHQGLADSGAVVYRGPHAFPLARVADETVRFLLVEADRSGADITLYDTATHEVRDTEGQTVVQGDHDELSKVRSGGAHHRRIQARVEDSWERNAETVAHELDRIVSERNPELILLTGDVRAVALVQEALGSHAQEITGHLEGGSRAEGVHEEAFNEKLGAALVEFRLRRREAVLDRFRQEMGRDQAATTGLSNVVDVLRKGQVDELVLSDAAAGPPSSLREQRLWVGDSALQLGTSKDEVTGLGSGTAEEVRADLALGAAVIESGAGITVVDEASVDLVDGVGAILRWHDDATPADTAFTLSGDTNRS